MILSFCIYLFDSSELFLLNDITDLKNVYLNISFHNMTVHLFNQGLGPILRD